jgi:hypothetical protein
VTLEQHITAYVEKQVNKEESRKRPVYPAAGVEFHEHGLTVAEKHLLQRYNSAGHSAKLQVGAGAKKPNRQTRRLFLALQKKCIRAGILESAEAIGVTK